MIRSLLVTVLAVACASCAPDIIHQPVWSLARTDADHNEVYLGGHLSLEACRRAGYEWFTETHEGTGVLECRLNCRKVRNGPVTCEATEPVG